MKSTSEITVIEIGTTENSGPQKPAQKQISKAKSSLPAKAEAESAPAESSLNSSERGSGDESGGGGEIQAPKVIKESLAKYPKAAKAAGIEGIVEMQLLIDTDGHVQSADLIRGPGYGLNEAAMAAMKEFVFSPALRKGEKVSAKIIYRYRFVLR